MVTRFMPRRRPKILCIFCRERRLQAEEHVWSNWLGRELLRRTGHRGWAAVHHEEHGVLNVDRRIAYSSRIPNVCEVCNGGWMRDIEESARPLLIPVIFDGTAMALNHDEQDRVACWIYLRVLVLQAATEPSGKFPQYHYWQMEETHRPPVAGHIFLGSLARRDPAFSVFHSRSLDTAGRLALREMGQDAYCATLSIGPLAARVFIHSPLAEKGGHFANVETPGFGHFLVPIWPHNLNATWPPALDWHQFLGLIATIPTATFLSGA
jgi:hypothetical protein